MTSWTQTKMTRFAPKDFLLVFLGGALGSLLRYLVGGTLELTLGASLAGSLSLLLVNVIGATFLGYTTTNKRFASEDQKSFLSAGFCGGFTTMSGMNFPSSSLLASCSLNVTCFVRPAISATRFNEI